jgi:hypothetical protein
MTCLCGEVFDSHLNRPDPRFPTSHGPRRNPEVTIEQLISALAGPELVAAVQRVRAGYGLHVVK